jgi:hypothetical protein
MSENYRCYKAKMEARRRSMSLSITLQLHELLETVARCEAMWALEDRIEKSR